MKIGYLMQQGVDIVGPVYNGPASHVREVIAGLARRGHDVRTLVRLNGRILSSDDLSEFNPIAAHWMDRGPLRWFERGVRRVQSELHLPYAAMFESLRFRQVCLQELRNFDLLYERLSWVAYGGG